ncbi:MAG TPA: DsbA family oxidoreductase [Acidimicrobiales bacterium]|nr:DsbA family oxidoreductase [Acidimicrobiales bacterium]
MNVDIWSDVVCPWCSIGRARFARALEQFEHRDSVTVVWRSYELDPSAGPSEGAPAGPGGYAARLAAKYGTSVGEAEERIEHITSVAATEGLDFRFDRMRRGNTFDAHRLLHLALDRGVQEAAKERIDRATFSEGLPVSDIDALVQVGVDAGLDADEVRDVLESEKYADSVRADEAQATAYGIRGVPFFVVDGRYGVSGAQTPEVLLDVLQQAWNDARS